MSVFSVDELDPDLLCTEKGSEGAEDGKRDGLRKCPQATTPKYQMSLRI